MAKIGYASAALHQKNLGVDVRADDVPDVVGQVLNIVLQK